MRTLCRKRNCKVKRKRYSRNFQRIAVERVPLARALVPSRFHASSCRDAFTSGGLAYLLESGEESARASTHHEGSYRKKVEFVVHNENIENVGRDSKKLAGEQDSNAILFPRPLLLLQDATKTE